MQFLALHNITRLAYMPMPVPHSLAIFVPFRRAGSMSIIMLALCHAPCLLCVCSMLCSPYCCPQCYSTAACHTLRICSMPSRRFPFLPSPCQSACGTTCQSICAASCLATCLIVVLSSSVALCLPLSCSLLCFASFTLFRRQHAVLLPACCLLL